MRAQGDPAEWPLWTRRMGVCLYLACPEMYVPRLAMDFGHGRNGRGYGDGNDGDGDGNGDGNAEEEDEYRISV